MYIGCNSMKDKYTRKRPLNSSTISHFECFINSLHIRYRFAKMLFFAPHTENKRGIECGNVYNSKSFNATKLHALKEILCC